MFFNNGTKYEKEFQVNSYLADNQKGPRVVTLNNDKFIIVWNSDGQDGSGYGVYGQLFNSVWKRYGGEFIINDYIINDQTISSLARLNEDEFVVIWNSDGQDGSGTGIYGRIFAVDDVPQLISNSFIFTEDQAIPITSAILNTTDIEDQPDSLTYQISYITNGRFTLVSDSVTPITVFTQQQIIDREIQFIHEDEEAPFFYITVKDSALNAYSRTPTIIFTPINDMPTLVNNKLSINEGETVILTSDDLSATDVDNDDAMLTFIINDVRHGRFERKTDSGHAITSFTQQEVLDGNIQFVHDGSTLVPYYRVSVSDGDLQTEPVAPFVRFNPGLESSLSISKLPIRSSISEHPTSNILPSLIGGIIAGLVACTGIGGIAAYWWYRKHRRYEGPPEVALQEIDKKSRKKRISIMKQDGTLKVSLLINYDKLKFVEKIGGGGSGVVYKGRWQHTNVAIKQLFLVGLDESAERDFIHETSIMAKLRHPNIVQLFGVCLEPECCIVMEYMGGGSLYKMLHSEEELSWTLRWRIALDIGQGLAHLHAENILHRDLKSLNVLLDKDKRAKLTDFGLSKVDTQTIATMTKKGLGTPRWLPPEVIETGKEREEQQDYTKKSDVYSYGIILWELATREVPYSAIDNEFTVMKKIKKGVRPKDPKECPETFSTLIKHCWSDRQEVRPEANEVVQILEAHQNEVRIEGREIALTL